MEKELKKELAKKAKAKVKKPRGLTQGAAEIISLRTSCNQVSRNVRLCLPFLEELFADRSGVKFDSNPTLFGFKDTVYDIEKRENRPYRREDYMTQHCGYAHREPTADEIGKLHATIAQVMPGEMDRETLLVILSTGLVGITLEKFVIFNGNGRNGKSWLNELLAECLGRYFYRLPTDVLTNPLRQGNNPQVASLNRKRMVVTSEPTRGHNLYNSTIKELTGGNKLNARMNHSNDCEVDLCSTLVMECNKKPMLQEGGETVADSERIIDLHFPSTFTEDAELIQEYPETHFPQDKYLKTQEYRDAHRHAFFSILVEAYTRYKTVHGSMIPLAPSTRARTKAYLKSSNPILNWFEETYTKISEIKLTREGCRDHFSRREALKIQHVLTEFQDTEIFKNMPRIAKSALVFKRFLENFSESGNYSKYIFHEVDYKVGGERMRGEYLIGFVRSELDE